MNVPQSQTEVVAKRARSSLSMPPSGASSRETVTKSKAGLCIAGLNFFYGKAQALDNISIQFETRKITALIGPSGCGKSTFLRTLNRMYETVKGARLEGRIELDGVDLLSSDVNRVRRKIGMVFQKSNPFPKSIFDNVAFGLDVNG